MNKPLMNSIDKVYTPHTIEGRWYQFWDQHHYFAPRGTGTSFSMILPPPNVTGSLHLGHGFSFTLMDIMVRYQRMCGHNVLWQAGTDHAGIATQMVVERQLNAQNKSRHDLGRTAFIEKIWEWKKESGGNITRQMQRLGASIDWERERFTLDPEVSYAVREVFIQLYEQGLIYRGKRLVNWDPVLLTAISDLEVENQEEEGKLWHIRYPVVDSDRVLTVATTRPETLLGDVAVAVHPEDTRYIDLVGQQIQLPLTTRTIPIIADEYVDPEFGSGAVKITPAHDFNDYIVAQRHQLEPINIFTPNAHLNENVPPSYQGLERFAARDCIIKDLTALGLIDKIEKHALKIPRGDRSNAIIEPYLTYQWYVDSKMLAESAIKAVSSGEIKFIPENWNKTYFQWMENIEDWCISRQLWWGHRIPIWYDPEGQAYAGHDEADVRARHHLSSEVKLTQDEDVLDTWFSSALWPFSSLGWPEETSDFKTFFPTTLLITGFDIIFFWVARMIMMSLKFTGKIPFKDVYITGLIRDAEGKKMSKTKGNVLDPIDLIDGIDLEQLITKRTSGLMQPQMKNNIEKLTRKEFPQGIPSYGTDALRFTFCALATYTREIRFDIQRLAGNRNFCNKLWNASRFVMMNTTEEIRPPQKTTLTTADRWILSHLQNTIQTAHHALSQYRFDLFAQTLYEFTWNEFCDWYVELAKPILVGDDSIKQNAARHTLVFVLETMLRLLHPVMPFITEEIWQGLPITKSVESIMLAAYPQSDPSLQDKEAEQEITWLKRFVTAVRTVRSEMNISPAKIISIHLAKGTIEDKNYLARHQTLIHKMIKADEIDWIANHEIPKESASAFVGDLEVFIPLAGLIDVATERTRLQKELDKLEKDKTLLQHKLNNASFLTKAPKNVVEKETERLHLISKTIQQLQEQLTKLLPR